MRSPGLQIAPIVVFDPRPQYQTLKVEIDEAVANVLESGWFVQGEQHRLFEEEFARFCTARHGIGVANGTDAIRSGLQALGVEPGDDVVTVANAGVPPVFGVREAGARPVFVDVDPGHSDPRPPGA